MKCSIIGILTAAICLFLSGQSYAYEVHNETDSADKYWTTAGGGEAYATYGPTYGWAAASAVIEDEETNYSGFAWTESYRTTYITNYIPGVDPNLTGIVEGSYTVYGVVTGNAGSSDFYVLGSASGYGGGGSGVAEISFSDPVDSDIDVDWFRTEVDMSYNGASCSYQFEAYVGVAAYSTSGMVDCGARADTSTTVTVEEE